MLELWADRDVMLAAARRDHPRAYREYSMYGSNTPHGFGALQCIAIAATLPRPHTDEEFCRTVVEYCLANTSLELDWADLRLADSLLADREIVIAAVRGCGEALQFATPALRADREVVMQAVCSCGEAIHYASAVLQRDPSIQLAAVVQTTHY